MTYNGAQTLSSKVMGPVCGSSISKEFGNVKRCQKPKSACFLSNTLFYCLCAFLLFFLEFSFEWSWFLCFMLTVRLINKTNQPQMSNMLPKAGEWSGSRSLERYWKESNCVANHLSVNKLLWSMINLLRWVSKQQWWDFKLQKSACPASLTPCY